MKSLLIAVLALVGLAWGWEAFHTTIPANAHRLWFLRQEALYFTGVASISLMSLAMFLATRPVWLELPLNGMDRIYRTHKWAGIGAVGLAAAHWLIEMTDDILKLTIGRGGRLPRQSYEGIFEPLRDLAKDVGEWAIYGVLAMLVITLWKRIPYRPWRTLHRIMPALYLMLVFHAVLLAPAGYWLQPVGVLLALFVLAGSYGAIRSLSGSIGLARQTNATIVSIEKTSSDITSVRCRTASGWPGHRAGQFAFITFDRTEGMHPFTIASADRADHVIAFEIKGLGDYTRGLDQRLRSGQDIIIEGPYGRFDLTRVDWNARQIWVAGGIGITPFLAWLDSLAGQPLASRPVELHYCTRAAVTDPFVPRLVKRCSELPFVSLQVHDQSQGERLTADRLPLDQPAEIWFCGPPGLARSIRATIPPGHRPRPRFYQELFEMR